MNFGLMLAFRMCKQKHKQMIFTGPTLAKNSQVSIKTKYIHHNIYVSTFWAVIFLTCTHFPHTAATWEYRLGCTCYMHIKLLLLLIYSFYTNQNIKAPGTLVGEVCRYERVSLQKESSVFWKQIIFVPQICKKIMPLGNRSSFPDTQVV